MTIRAVVEGGYCIGCGACKLASRRISIEFNTTGDLTARLPADLSPAELAAASRVCPFATDTDETALAKAAFSSEQDIKWHGEVGATHSTMAAYAPAYRSQGSSGGMATWLIIDLMQRGLIDAAIHVAPSFGRADGRRFSYTVSDRPDGVAHGATSFYFPVSLDEVIDLIKSRPGRYAVTGIPCFQKALRLLRRDDAIIDERVRYQIGIVCGQMKSSHYLEYLAATAGARGELSGACFRRKVQGFPADDYAFEARSRSSDAGNGEAVARVMNSRIGTNWGMGYFKPRACDFCDDVLAETADVAVMDAWLPKYVGDGRGWSLVVLRHSTLAEVHSAAAQSGAIVTEAVSAEDVAESQRGGFSHRRGALGYRLWRHRRDWTPRKRVVADPSLPLILKVEQWMRDWLRRRSREVWRAVRAEPAAIDIFRTRMKWPERLYKVLQRTKRKLKTRPPGTVELRP